MTSVVSFLSAFAVTAFIMPFLIRLARSQGLYDEPGERKIHTTRIPRLGGVGIFAGVAVGFVVALFAAERLGQMSMELNLSVYVLFGAAAASFFLGLVDDLKGLNAWIKFAVETVLALALMLAGYGFTSIEIPIAPYSLSLGLLGPFVTWLWIVGVMNAVNLIDGMDGLAGGLCLIAFGVWGTLYLKGANYMATYLAIVSIGAVAGFLFFNFPPALIFMGDSGSLFLGFILASLPLMRMESSPIHTELMCAVTVAFIPILDTFAAIVRRLRRRVSVFSADREHLHHRLMARGLDVREILALVYAIAAILGTVVIITRLIQPAIAFYVCLTSWVLCVFLYTWAGRGLRRHGESS